MKRRERLKPNRKRAGARAYRLCGFWTDDCARAPLRCCCYVHTCAPNMHSPPDFSLLLLCILYCSIVPTVVVARCVQHLSEAGSCPAPREACSSPQHEWGTCAESIIACGRTTARTRWLDRRPRRQGQVFTACLPLRACLSCGHGLPGAHPRHRPRAATMARGRGFGRRPGSSGSLCTALRRHCCSGDAATPATLLRPR